MSQFTYYYQKDLKVYDRDYRINITATSDDQKSWNLAIDGVCTQNSISLGVAASTSLNVNDSTMLAKAQEYLNAKLAPITTFEEIQMEADVFYGVFRVMQRPDGKYSQCGMAYLDSARTKLLACSGERLFAESDYYMVYGPLMEQIVAAMGRKTMIIDGRTYTGELIFQSRLNDDNDYIVSIKCVNTGIYFDSHTLSTVFTSYADLQAIIKAEIEVAVDACSARPTYLIEGKNYYAAFRVMKRSMDGDCPIYSHWAAIFTDSARTKKMFSYELAGSGDEFLIEAVSNPMYLYPDMQGELVEHLGLV